MVSNPPALALPQKTIRILLVEDEQADAELIKFALREVGFPFTLRYVDTREGFIHELEENPPDLILSDYSLPSIDGHGALKILQQLRPEIPLIFVTGTLGEERAIETLKRGATDFVLKTRLSRLVPAVHRALREASDRQEGKRAQRQLQESHEKLRALSTYLQYVREEERTRIAREVHDELGQALTGLKFRLSAIPGSLPGESDSLQDKLHDLCNDIDSIIHTVRRIATELRPGILDDLGLVAAIEWQANEFQDQSGVACNVETPDEEVRLEDEARTALFRIYQETLTNVMRHAEATEVDVQLKQEDGVIRLLIADNGRGITPEELASARSLGLLGMRERASLLSGDFQIGSREEGGTLVSVSIPQSPGSPRKGNSP